MDELTLLDWKRRVFAMYAAVRAEADPQRAWTGWRATRDALFAGHPQSPLSADDRLGFACLDVYPYDPVFRVLAEVEPVASSTETIAASGGGTMTFARVGVARFPLAGAERELDLHWVQGYGGGLFLSFQDETSGEETYGGTRYLLDTIKGADLGERGGSLVVDFNFAYNPSCSYDPRWVCPLTPRGNVLPVPVRAGERHPHRANPRDDLA